MDEVNAFGVHAPHDVEIVPRPHGAVLPVLRGIHATKSLYRSRLPSMPRRMVAI